MVKHELKTFITICWCFLRQFILTASTLERAKSALSVLSDKDFAEQLGISASTVVGYKQRGVVPLEQCIKIAEKTGVSLDWLILGKEVEQAPAAPVLSVEQQMLLVGWNSLDKEAQDYVFNIVRCLARGESVLEATRHTINIHASAGQVNAGNGNIENLNMGK